ncbi:MAG TPA: O-methyltransferase [Bacteroidia bacterium]|nr:O-methyltransferase [Bacteroidia bacterium]
MQIVNPEIEKYCEKHSEPESELLQKINRETHLEVLMPRMLSGHLQGRFLAMISKMIKPKFILEIGTFTGYASLCLVEGLEENGQLFTIDINEELAPRVNGYFTQHPKASQLNYINGDAMAEIPKIKVNFDLVFIDADKKNYAKYFDLVIDKVNAGGYIISDNVLWSGKVIDMEAQNDADTLNMLKFNEKLVTDKRVEAMLLPLRDGLMICRKI